MVLQCGTSPNFIVSMNLEKLTFFNVLLSWFVLRDRTKTMEIRIKTARKVEGGRLI